MNISWSDLLVMKSSLFLPHFSISSCVQENSIMVQIMIELHKKNRSNGANLVLTERRRGFQGLHP